MRLLVHRGGERLPTGERVKRGGSVVDGEAVYALSRPARAGERLVLLNYAAVIPREPIELDEVAVSTYIDGPFQAGRLDLLDHQGSTAVRRIGERGDLELELRAGETQVRLAYRVTVPHRYWPFGCSRRRCGSPRGPRGSGRRGSTGIARPSGAEGCEDGGGGARRSGART